jgi:D-3-phosphoglycerate dehydrogenase
MMDQTRRVAVTTASFGEHDEEPLRRLASSGLEVARNETGRTLAPEETTQLLQGCVGVVAGTERYDAAVLASLPDLRVISRVGAGIDAIDADAAAAHGIAVMNTPWGPTLAVAELTLALILDMLRRVSRMDRDVRAGIWKKRMGNQLAGKRVGVVGFGRIGRTVAGKLAALDAEVRFCDLHTPGDPAPCERMTFDELLGWADIVSLHCTMSEGCALMGERELSLMRPGGFLVNTSRGGLVDESALYDALDAGHLAGAALDVYGREPYEGPLSSLDSVVLTPHVGSYAAEGRAGMELEAVENLLAALGEDR